MSDIFNPDSGGGGGGADPRVDALLAENHVIGTATGTDVAVGDSALLVQTSSEGLAYATVSLTKRAAAPRWLRMTDPFSRQFQAAAGTPDVGWVGTLDIAAVIQPAWPAGGGPVPSFPLYYLDTDTSTLYRNLTGTWAALTATVSEDAPAVEGGEVNGAWHVRYPAGASFELYQFSTTGGSYTASVPLASGYGVAQAILANTSAPQVRGSALIENGPEFTDDPAVRLGDYAVAWRSLEGGFIAPVLAGPRNPLYGWLAAEEVAGEMTVSASAPTGGSDGAFHLNTATGVVSQKAAGEWADFATAQVVASLPAPQPTAEGLWLALSPGVVNVGGFDVFFSGALPLYANTVYLVTSAELAALEARVAALEGA
jgi:hypothetical protein